MGTPTKLRTWADHAKIRKANRGTRLGDYILSLHPDAKPVGTNNGRVDWPYIKGYVGGSRKTWYIESLGYHVCGGEGYGGRSGYAIPQYGRMVAGSIVKVW